MKIKQEKRSYDVGVIVGRFQTAELHHGHKELIDSVIAEHPKVIIFLGVPPTASTIRNPLDFEMRKQMILSSYDVNVLYIKDVPYDDLWSKNLDQQISDIVSPTQTVVLYGSRDSFINHYKGKYDTIELENESFYSATEERKKIGKQVKPSLDFRKGVIWAAQNKYPICFTTVDIAIYDKEKRKILLGRKDFQSLFRFIGGFSSPSSPSFENDAKREVMEETGLNCDNLQYIGSTIIDDWRYRQELDKIKTIFYSAQYIFGRPEANDDICELKWFDYDTLTNDDIVPEHHDLLYLLHNNKSFELNKNIKTSNKNKGESHE